MMLLFMDTETAETPTDEKGSLMIDNGQVYDLGLMVMDDKGNVYDQISLVNEDVFFGMPESMKNAYFAEKMPQYLTDMRMGERKIVNTWKMYQIFHQLCDKWNIDAVVAHNAMFDVKVLNATMRYQTKSRCRWFLPWDMKIIDTMALARETFLKDQTYVKWCNDNGYITSHGTPRPRLTAEILYRFITGNNEFIESHTGLEDVKIESKIFLACMEKMGM